mgnify:CR=1 FL=1
MELGVLVVVLAVLLSAVAAVRRDPRFDRRETVVQLAWIAAYMAGCVALALMLRPLGRRIGVPAAVALAVLIPLASMVVLARHLKRRLDRRA